MELFLVGRYEKQGHFPLWLELFLVLRSEKHCHNRWNSFLWEGMNSIVTIGGTLPCGEVRKAAPLWLELFLVGRSEKQGHDRWNSFL